MTTLHITNGDSAGGTLRTFVSGDVTITADPLHEGPDPADVGAATISLTAAGRDVAAGRQDAVAINGIDEWRGGVHLHGTDRSPWRWDAGRETLLS